MTDEDDEPRPTEESERERKREDTINVVLITGLVLAYIGIILAVLAYWITGQWPNAPF